MSRRPNFLIFVSDQHRPDHTGFGGNELLRTPNLDAIAARGTRFERAIVANPICMPNRSTLVTGRMPSLERLARTQMEYGDSSPVPAYMV